ncbi:hypothetical protein DFH08DRAFT_978329 [Mycena albidolilacea]|uniref:BTB domain-containing protein n=1 Tax=Mycena albidolilacea TaxID=1033008 RepID=A0AAD6YZ23_9AGAR|nr:hypothetical protein DFH08DRAFT_978329 [Mycena albidolilacea]
MTDTSCSLDSFDSTNVNLIVEGTKYKIHRFFLSRDSPVLREMFSKPKEQAAGREPEWTLSDVTKSELEHLLWVYYNPSINSYSANLNIAVWRDVLKLADMWQMYRIQRIARGHILGYQNLDPIEKIKLCEDCRYDAKDAYIKVCTREEASTSTEFQVLGIDLVLLIMQIRERIIGNRRESERTEEDIVVDIIGREPDMPYAMLNPEYC